MNENFKKLIWLSGHFGVLIREHAEELVYKGKYGKISANNTFAKLEREYGLFKRLDRGKRKTDGFRLTPLGIKYFKLNFFYEPKVFVSSDKLLHSVKILSFYVQLYKDAINRKIIDNLYINEEKKLIDFYVHRQINFGDKFIISDGFCIYRYAEKRGLAFFLEIENSDRRSSMITSKTLENYEGYYYSGQWRNEPWQPLNSKIFPVILIVTFSEFKMKDLIRHFKLKMKVGLRYYFTYYSKLEKEGFSGNIWNSINETDVKLIN